MDIMSTATHDFKLPLRIADNSLGRFHGSSTLPQAASQWSPGLASSAAISHLPPTPVANAASDQTLSAKLPDHSQKCDKSTVTPMSPRDWEAKKEIIRRLYLVENLPLKELIDVMRRVHGFHATERMYKRQFVKWGWKKYHTKGLQDGLVERPPGKATCKRPARRRILRVFTKEDLFLHITSNLSVRLNHGSDLDWMKHAIFTSQRDIIFGTLRRDPEWMTREKFNTYRNSGDRVLDVFLVGKDLLVAGDLQRAGAAFRQGFRSLENALDEEPIDFFQTMFLEIPYCIPTYSILRAYYRHMYRLLNLKRPEEPITLIAAMISKLEAEDLTYLFAVMEEMHRVVNDIYNEVLGEDDLRSLYAGRELLCFEVDTDDTSREYDRICRTYENLLAKTIEVFGQFSSEAFDVELRLIIISSQLDPLRDRTTVLYERYLARVRSATRNEPQDTWEFGLISGHQLILKHVGLFYINSGDVEAGIACLRDSVIACKHAMLKVDDEGRKFAYACDILRTRYKLVNILINCGKTGEADKMKTAITASDCVETMVQNDLGENFDEYIRILR